MFRVPNQRNTKPPAPPVAASFSWAICRCPYFCRMPLTFALRFQLSSRQRRARFSRADEGSLFDFTAARRARPHLARHSREPLGCGGSAAFPSNPLTEISCGPANPAPEARHRLARPARAGKTAIREARAPEVRHAPIPTPPKSPLSAFAPVAAGLSRTICRCLGICLARCPTLRRLCEGWEPLPSPSSSRFGSRCHPVYLTKEGTEARTPSRAPTTCLDAGGRDLSSISTSSRSRHPNSVSF